MTFGVLNFINFFLDFPLIKFFIFSFRWLPRSVVFVEVRRQKCSTMGQSPATPAGQSLIAKVMMKVMKVVYGLWWRWIIFDLLLLMWVSVPRWSDQGSFPLKCWDCFDESRQHSCWCLWTNVLVFASFELITHHLLIPGHSSDEALETEKSTGFWISRFGKFEETNLYNRG